MNTQRQREILEILSQQRSATVQELASMLYASEPTIRRDLQALEKKKMIRRTRGGAELPLNTADTPLPWEIRLNKSSDQFARNQMLKSAVSLVHDGDVIMMDSSATVYRMIPLLKTRKNLIVLTNSLYAATLMSRLSIKTYIAGGLVKEQCGASIGDEATRMLKRFTADIAFISCSGLSPSGKITERSVEENYVRRVMLENCKRSVLMITQNRYNLEHMHTLCGIQEVDEICTDAPLPSEIRRIRDEYGKKPEIVG